MYSRYYLDIPVEASRRRYFPEATQVPLLPNARPRKEIARMERGAIRAPKAPAKIPGTVQSLDRTRAEAAQEPAKTGHQFRLALFKDFVSTFIINALECKNKPTFFQLLFRLNKKILGITLFVQIYFKGSPLSNNPRIPCFIDHTALRTFHSNQ